MPDSGAMTDAVPDIPYLAQLVREQMPARLAHVARVRGLAPVAPDAAFTYCDLGCGPGFTAAAVAALHPQATVHAVDVQPGHAESARALARAGGLANLHVHTADFRDLPALPAFDVIALHGVWSWIDAATRDAVAAFLADHLRDGGYAYVSYNALPGAAASAPVRRLLQRHAAALPDTMDPAVKARRALAAVQDLRDQGGWFADNPVAARAVDDLATRDPAYVAHEFLGGTWEPFYHDTVAAEMARAGLAFAADAEPALNHTDAVLPDAALDGLKAAPDPGAVELHKDFLLSRGFRRDVYGRAPAALDEAARTEALLGAPYHLTVDRAAFTEQCHVGRVTLTLRGPAFDLLLDGLEQGTARPADFPRVQGLDAEARRAVATAVDFLVARGQAELALEPARPTRAAGRALAFRPALNRTLLDAAFRRGGAEQAAAISPVTGDAVTVPRAHGEALLRAADGEAVEADTLAPYLRLGVLDDA